MKKYFLFILVIAFALVLVFIYSLSLVERSSRVEIKTENTDQEKPITPSNKDGDEKFTNKNLVSSKETNLEQIYEKNEWLRENGFEYMFNADGSPFPVKESSSVYDAYSIENLTSMAQSDPRSALELGLRFVDKNEYDKARIYLRSAAVDGYGRGLTALGKSYVQEARGLLKREGKSEEADKLLIEGHAWGHIMHLRFYPEQTEPTMAGRLDIEDERWQSIKKAANKRAMELYDEIQSDRSAKGLGEFDNYIPDSFKQ